MADKPGFARAKLSGQVIAPRFDRSRRYLCPLHNNLGNRAIAPVWNALPCPGGEPSLREPASPCLVGPRNAGFVCNGMNGKASRRTPGSSGSPSGLMD